MNTGILGGNRSHIGRESYLGVNEKNYRKGFTLVELIVVLVILAILAAIAVPVTLGFIDKANDKKIIKNAEVSMTATQTVLNQAYNEGVGRLALTKRAAAYDMAAKASNEGEFDNTEFSVWTSKRLDDGTTKATEEFSAAFLIKYALFKTADGRFAFYDGDANEWKVFDDDTKLKANAVFASLKDEDKIPIWPASERDHAYNPKYDLDGQDDGWITDEDIYNFSESITIVLMAKTENKGANIAFSPVNSFPYDVNSTFATELAKCNPQYSRYYDSDSIKWEFTDDLGTHPLSAEAVDAYLKPLLEQLAEKDVPVVLTADMDHKTISVPISFSAYSDALTVSVSGDSLTYEYDLVTDEVVAPDWSVSVTSGKAGDENRESKIATFDGNWFINESNDPGTYSFVKNGDNYVKVPQGQLKTYVQTYAQASIDHYLETGEAPESLNFVAPADIHKSVYMWAIEPGTDGNVNVENTKEVKFNKQEKFAYSLTFSRHEVENTFVKDESGKNVYQYVRNGNVETIQFVGDYSGYNADNDLLKNKSDFSTKDPENEAGTTKPKTKQQFKYWYGYVCDKDGNNIDLSKSLFDRTRDDISKKVLTKLYARGNEDTYGEFVGIDVSDMNCLLLHNEKQQEYTGQQDYSVLIGEWKALADNNLSKIKSVTWVSKESKPGYENCYKERCISTTKLKVLENGKYDLDGEREYTDPDYPCYIVAYSVPNGEGYDIRIFTEDDTDMKALNSLQGLFADFSQMETNTFVEHTDMSEVVRTKEMFKNCPALESLNLYRFEHVSTSDSTEMFKDCKICEFTNLECFDTSQIIYLRSMFDGCEAFPENYTLDISSAKIMDCAFRNCKNLEKVTLVVTKDTGNHLGEKNNTNVSGTNSIKDIFTGCENLTEITMEGVETDSINSLSNFFYPVKDNLETVNLVNCKFGNITSTSKLFENFKELKEVKLENTSMPNLTDMTNFFNGCKELVTVKIGGGQQNLFGATLNTAYMFNGCSNLKNDDLDLSGLKTVTMANNMFRNCKALTSVPETLKTEVIGDMSYMFYGCSALESGEEGLTIRIDSSKNINNMFQGCSGLTKVILDGGEGKAPELQALADIFKDCTSLEDLTVKNIEQTGNKLTSITSFTSGAKTGLKHVTFESLTLPGVTSTKEAFKDCTKLETAKVELNGNHVTSASGMFNGCSNLSDVTLSGFEAVTNMSYMFQNCASLSSVPGGLKPENATNLSYMFKGCSELKADEGLTVRIDSAEFINNMFDGCSKLTKVVLDGNKGKASGLKNVSNIFKECTGLTDLTVKNIEQTSNNLTDISLFVSGAKTSLKNVTFESLTLPGVITTKELFNEFAALETATIDMDAQNVTSTLGMFNECTNLTSVDISKFNTPNNKSTNKMFRNCTKLKNSDIIFTNDDSQFDVSSVTDMNYMFAGCIGLTDLVEPELLHAEKMEYMYTRCTNLKEVTVTLFSDTKSIANIFADCSSLKTVTFKGKWGQNNPVPGAGDSTGCNLTNNGSLHIFMGTETNMGIEVLNFEDLYFLNYSNSNGKDDTTSGLHYILSDVKTAKTLKKITFKNVSAPGIKSASQLLLGCKKLVWADLSGLTLENNEITRRMFYECESLTGITDDTHYLNIDGIVTNKVSNTQTMFGKCTGLLEFKVNKFNTTRSGIDMQWMFQGCSNVKTIYLNSNATNAIAKEMFDGCGSLETIYAVENFTVKGGSSADMFRNCSMIKGDAGTTYLGSGPQYARIDGGNSKPGYFTSLP